MIPALAAWPPCTIFIVYPPMSCSAMEIGSRYPALPTAFSIPSYPCPISFEAATAAPKVPQVPVGRKPDRV